MAVTVRTALGMQYLVSWGLNKGRANAYSVIIFLPLLDVPGRQFLKDIFVEK